MKQITKLIDFVYELIKKNGFWTAMAAIAAALTAWISYSSFIAYRTLTEKQLQINYESFKEQLRANRPYISTNVDKVDVRKYFQPKDKFEKLRIKLLYKNEGNRYATNFKMKLLVIKSLSENPVINKKSLIANDIQINIPFRTQFVIDIKPLLSDKVYYIYIEYRYTDPITSDKHIQHIFYKTETLKYPDNYYDFNIIYATLDDKTKILQYIKEREL